MRGIRTTSFNEYQQIGSTYPRLIDAIDDWVLCPGLFDWIVTFGGSIVEPYESAKALGQRVYGSPVYTPPLLPPAHLVPGTPFSEAWTALPAHPASSPPIGGHHTYILSPLPSFG